MDTVLLKTQETALDHNSQDAKSDYQKMQDAHRDAAAAGRVVPEFKPVLSLEQRVAALEAKVFGEAQPADLTPATAPVVTNPTPSSEL